MRRRAGDRLPVRARRRARRRRRQRRVRSKGADAAAGLPQDRARRQDHVPLPQPGRVPARAHGTDGGYGYDPSDVRPPHRYPLRRRARSAELRRRRRHHPDQRHRVRALPRLLELLPEARRRDRVHAARRQAHARRARHVQRDHRRAHRHRHLPRVRRHQAAHELAGDQRDRRPLHPAALAATATAAWPCAPSPPAARRTCGASPTRACSSRARRRPWCGRRRARP